MNTKIKLFGGAVIALMGLFLGAGFASAATLTTCSSAVVSGTLLSTGGAPTTVWFEWGTSQSNVDTGLGIKTTTQSFTVAPGSFTQEILGLNQSTTYFYRAVFSNTYGTSQGVTRSFTTPTCSTGNTSSLPTVTTNSATSVSQNSATLNGYVTPNGAATSAWFEYGTTQSFGNTTSNINYGTGATSFNNTVFSLSQNTTYYYRAAAQNSQGTQYGNTLSFTTSGQTQTVSQPYVSTNSASSISTNSATLNGYVAPNGTNTFTWFEWGTSYSLGNRTSSNGPSAYYDISTSFNAPLYNLNPNTTYYYRAAAQSSYGTQYGSTLSFTTSGQTYTYTAPVYTGSAPTASTLLATELTGTTAKLNGLVSSADNTTSSAWYEWGTTGSLGNKSPTINIGALPVVKHSDFITGLTKGQTYYYRIVAQNTYGTSYGVVNSFVSEPNTYVVTQAAVQTARVPAVLKPTTTVVTRGTAAQSLVMLSIEGGDEMIVAGEKRTYRVHWKNESTQTLKNVVLRVTFPKSMSVDSATKGSFAAADNSVVVDLKTLAPGEDGDTFIFTTAGRGVKAGEVLVVPANMVYTGTNGVQGDAVAYVMHRVELTQNVLGASAFGAGEFVPTTLFEWILLLILVLSLVLLGNHLYGRFSDVKH